MSLKDRIVKFLAEQPKPGVVVQFAPGRVCVFKAETLGSGSDLKKENFITRPLPPEVLEANYLKPNIKDKVYLQKVLDDLLAEIKLDRNSASLLLPEMSARVFIFPLENGLTSPVELNNFVEWRLSRQLSQNITQIRYSYQVFNSGREKKILVLCSAAAVVKEYESLFQARKIHPGKVTIPSLSVLNLIFSQPEREDDLLVADLDHDYLSLVALAREGFLLYRQKQVWPEVDFRQTAEEVTNEIENTVNFVEDKLRRKLKAIYLRSNLDQTGEIEERLKALAPVKVKRIMPGQAHLVPLLGGL